MSEGKPLFVHVHVPKTAGTSLNLILQAWFKEQHLNLYQNDPAHVYSDAELEALVAQHPNVVSIASHSIRSFNPVIAGRPVLYYCILRDPVERFISTFTFVKKNFPWLSPEHRKNFPPNADHMPLKELVRERLGKEAKQVLKGSWLNRFFAARAYRSQKDYLAARQAWPQDMDDHECFQAVALPLSMLILDSFALVMLTEQFEESVEALRRLICSVGIEVPQIPVPEANTSRELREDTSWICQKDELGKIILDMLKNDRLLYDYGKECFKRKTHLLARTSAPVDRPEAVQMTECKS